MFQNTSDSQTIRIQEKIDNCNSQNLRSTQIVTSYTSLNMMMSLSNSCNACKISVSCAHWKFDFRPEAWRNSELGPDADERIAGGIFRRLGLRSVPCLKCAYRLSSVFAIGSAGFDYF